MKLDILAIGAHPDDIELGCGGTLLKEVSLGKSIGILDLTRGELGTRGTDETRNREANDAAGILGVKVRENLGLSDGFFELSQENILKVIDFIRKYQPDVVFSNPPTDRHPDHGKASELVYKACFLSGLHKIKTNYPAWRPLHHFNYIQWVDLKPDFILDITGFLEKKLEACLAYKTQFYNPEITDAPETPISNKNFTDSIIYRAHDLGRLINTEAGEGFISRFHIGLKSLDSIIGV